MKYTNPLKDHEEFIREEDGKFFMGLRPLMPLTEEQKKISKTQANYYFEHTETGNQFFCHLDSDRKQFCLAETITEKSHDVWLKDMKSITFYEGNIVLRDNNNHISQALRDEKEMMELIKKEYAEIKKEKQFILFEDPIKDEQIALAKEGKKWFLFNEEILPLTDEQKKISKTEANYALTKEGLTFFYKLDEETQKFALAETVGKRVHDVWLKNNNSISYSKINVILKDNTTHKLMEFEADSDFGDKIKQSYYTFKVPSLKISKENIEKDTNEVKSEVSVESLSYMQGLKKQIRNEQDASPSMMIAFGVYDMVTKGTGLKKNKFVKLGTAAGVVAIVAASPVGVGIATGALVLGTIGTIGLAIHTAVIAGDYTADFVGNKIKTMINKSDTNEPEVKSIDEIKGNISKMRSEALDTIQKTKHTI